MWMIRGSPKALGGLLELFGSRVQQSDLFRTMTCARGPYYFGGSTTAGIGAHTVDLLQHYS